MSEKRKVNKHVMRAIKIAIGSSLSIFVAELLNLDYATSAGTVALLTLLTTKWGTVKLSFLRIVTLAMTIALAWITVNLISSDWIAYGFLIFAVVLISGLAGLDTTISVNSVIAVHFIIERDFSPAFLLNETLIVLIGVVFAFLINLFSDYKATKQHIISCMRITEERLQAALEEMAVYLANEKKEKSVWKDLKELDELLKEYIIEACEYQDNTFVSHPGYYIDYFEMRLEQCTILRNLHYEMRKMRSMPAQAEIVSEYVLYLKKYVVEKNIPQKQMDELEQLFEDMRHQPLPKSREEFESRAILYHILMNLEEFLICKRRFVEGLDDKRRRIYWEEH